MIHRKSVVYLAGEWVDSCTLLTVCGNTMIHWRETWEWESTVLQLINYMSKHPSEFALTLLVGKHYTFLTVLHSWFASNIFFKNFPNRVFLHSNWNGRCLSDYHWQVLMLFALYHVYYCNCCKQGVIVVWVNKLCVRSFYRKKCNIIGLSGSYWKGNVEQ